MCRILAIAPYESMRNLIVNLCADRPEIQLTALVGDLEEGAKLVQTIPSEDYDIIISRGGTAEIIRTVTSIPVIDISMSRYDVLSVYVRLRTAPARFDTVLECAGLFIDHRRCSYHRIRPALLAGCCADHLGHRKPGVYAE